MRSKTPTVSFRSRWYTVYHLLVFLPMAFGLAFGVRMAAAALPIQKPSDDLLIGITLALGIGLYYGVFYLSKALLARRFGQGVRLLKQGLFQEAIPVFEEALAYFNRYPWLDRYRAVLLFSTSALSYREMCLGNLAFCYAQMGQAEKSEALYREVLELNPENAIAVSALKMIETFAGK